jgi:cysteinyl-tRNA synthetase
VFRRWLEYRGHHVISIINYTDIDDRIIDEAAKNNTGELDHVERIIAGFRTDSPDRCRSHRRGP